MVLEGDKNMLKMDIEYKNDILYVRLEGSLNERNSYKINNYLIPVLEKHNIKYLVYNLRYLDNIDLKGKDAILNSKYVMKKNNGKLLLCKGSREVYDIFKGNRLLTIDNEKDVLKFMEA